MPETTNTLGFGQVDLTTGPSIEEQYRTDVVPKERRRLATALGRTRRDVAAQGQAAQARNIDLSRRLGFAKTGTARGVQRSLSSSLADSLSNSLARRRAQFDEEIQAFRQAELEKIAGEKAQREEEILGRSADALQAFGTVLSVVPYFGGLGQFASSEASRQRGIAAEDTSALLQEAKGIEGQEFGGAQFAATSATPGERTESLGSRLASQQGSFLTPEDEEEEDDDMIGGF